ncbi:MAG TPA: hypothetical protein VFR24_06545 [Candidatus Angelobacter sp.]|nr:hypothetical protein [Candidatus Angelobacter sp.]
MSSIAGSAFAVLTALPKVIESFYSLKRSLRHVPDAATISQTELALDTNVRFHFHFQYPATWDRKDPGNSDGATYTNPQYPQVEIRGWGAYAAVWPTLEEFTSESLRIDHAAKGDKVMKVRSVVDSGRYLLRMTREDPSKEKIDGKRSTYDLYAGGRKYRAMQQFTQWNDRQISVRCLAPPYLYPAFELLFLKICSSLEILSEEKSQESISKRQQAIIQLLSTLKPNELVKTEGVYAAMLMDHRELMQGIDQAALEEELRKMADDGAIFFERLIRAWTLVDPIL